jgi:hypothetical protein
MRWPDGSWERCAGRLLAAVIGLGCESSQSSVSWRHTCGSATRVDAPSSPPVPCALWSS